MIPILPLEVKSGCWSPGSRGGFVAEDWAPPFFFSLPGGAWGPEPFTADGRELHPPA